MTPHCNNRSRRVHLLKHFNLLNINFYDLMDKFTFYKSIYSINPKYN